jgi:hypothetical protein
VTQSTAEYLSDTSLAMTEGHAGDCREHAYRIARLLIAEGRFPWIARIRETVVQGDSIFHGPLTPLRFLGYRGLTWTTHYVACDGTDAYDPILGEPVSLDGYTLRVFGREVAVETYLDCAATEQFLKSIP